MTEPVRIRDGSPDAAPRDGGVPVARYVLRHEHLVRAVLRTMAPGQRRIQTRYALYAVLALVMWSAGYAFTLGVTGVVLLYWAAAFLGLALVRPYFTRRHAERLVADRPDLDRPVEITVTARDLDIRVDGVSHGTQRLDTLHAVHVEPEGVFVEPFRHQALFVPADAFASPADRAAFERALLAGTRIPAPTL